jgi:hypothetical protein
LYTKNHTTERFIIKGDAYQDKYSTGIMQQLPDEFEYSALKILVAKDLCDKSISQDRKIALEEMVGGIHFIT